jgi:4-hydroxy-tetrahydrodipicolinate synthase
MYLALGDLNITMRHSDEIQEYRRGLSLQEATVNVSYSVGGVNYEREVFVSAPDQVMAIRIAADASQGKAKVFAGVMDTSTKRVIENIKRIEDAGCDAAVITPVFYDRHTSQGEIIRLFEDVAAATKIDLIAYNIPSFVVEKIEPATVSALADIDAVKGYKDSAAVFNDTVKVCNALADRPDFSILNGTPVQYMPSALLGCDGCVPGMASMYPKVFVEAYNASLTGDVELMRKFNKLICLAGSVYASAKNGTAAVKYAVSTMGFIHERILRPQDGCSPEEKAKVEKQMAICKETFEAEGVVSVL